VLYGHRFFKINRMPWDLQASFNSTVKDKAVALYLYINCQ